MIRQPSKLLREIAAEIAPNLRMVRVSIFHPCRLQPVFKKNRLPNYTVGDPRVDQPQMKKILSFLQEARPPTIPWGSVDDQLEDEMNPSTTYWRARTSLDPQEDHSPIPGDLRVDPHRRLDATHQVWQGPYLAACTQNLITVQFQITFSRAKEPKGLSSLSLSLFFFSSS
jgi:hypothetical protein